MSNENTREAAAPAPRMILLDKQEISVAVGMSHCLWAVVQPADATGYTVEWISTNPAVASVSNGNVTAHAEGTVTIKAKISGTDLMATCTVNVIPFVPVNSISVTPESLDLYVGEGYCLAAEVCPINATNPVITWTSKNEEIASVGEISGVVYAHKDGQTIITATVNDGTVEKTDSCILTVNTRPPVKGVNIEEDAVYMNQGERCTLHANVYPADAADRGVIWVSDNEAVAKVGASTGEVEAISAGSARISAVTQNLEFSDCVPVKVYKDTIIVSRMKLYKDGSVSEDDGKRDSNVEDSFIQVNFEKSGKFWRCVEHDLVFSEYKPPLLINRTKYNLYNDYDSAREENWNPTDVREYSDDELRLLYAIDPYGVAKYVQMYAQSYGGNHYGLNEKDRVFRALFNRDPKYYMRDAYGKWRVTSDTDDISCVLSESECIFGARQIRDFYSATTILNAVADFVLGMFPASVELVARIVCTACLEALIDIQKSPMDVLVDVAMNRGLENFLGQETEKPGENDPNNNEESNPLKWLAFIISLGNALGALAPKMELQLPFINGMIDYCVINVGYDIVMKNGNTIQKLDSIQRLLNEAVEN